ncbi:MAG: RNA polymerase sigma factor [Thermoanaerobaculia bacterium]
MTETRSEMPRDGDAASAPAPVRIVRGDERALLLRHREGDRQAFAALVAEYRRPVYSYLARCGVAVDDRDDLFQEVFLKIHRAAATYQAHRPVHPWIFTIVSNTARTYLRQRRVRQLVFAEPGEQDPPAATADGERAAVARQAVALLAAELPRLSLAQREVVLLAGVEKMSMKDAAAVLDMPVNTVKTHLRRARLHLARALARRQRGGAATARTGKGAS